MEKTSKLSSAPFSASKVEMWHDDYDVVVVGFGAAGACAAIEAAGAGVRVALFERSSGSGGASGLSDGEIYFGGNGGTPAQRGAGFEDDTEDFRRYLLMAGGPDADEAKVDCYARESLAHYCWLVDQGVPFKGTYLPGKIVAPETDDTLIWSGNEAAWPYCDRAKPAPRGHAVQHVGRNAGRTLMDRLEAKVRALGVEVRCNARVSSLIMSDDPQEIRGIVVQEGGSPRHIRARRAVVLCTGGFCLNQDMVRRHAPATIRLNDPMGDRCDGNGIMMANGIGAETVHMDEVQVTCPWYPPESLVKGIFVNMNGQRFINEDCYHGRVSRMALDQPGDRIFLLVDAKSYAQTCDAARIEIAATGETWAEVEAELAMPPGMLTGTVEFFNRHAAVGKDPMWHKAAKWLAPLDEPPFVALELRIGYSAFIFVTLGGLNTTVDGEVLRADGSRIPGLFAAGRATSGLPRTGYGYSSGMSLADCTFFGRRAGVAAAGQPDRQPAADGACDNVTAHAIG